MASYSDLEPYPVPTTIKVLQEDIDFGIRQDSYGCAVAHAIMRSNPDAIRVRVNRKKIAWSDARTDERYIYDTPESVDKRLIKPFDEGDPVKPTQFTLRSGQFRPIEHNDEKRAEGREYMRARKVRDAQEGVVRPHREFVQSNSDHTYERYVQTEGTL